MSMHQIRIGFLLPILLSLGYVDCAQKSYSEGTAAADTETVYTNTEMSMDADSIAKGIKVVGNYELVIELTEGQSSDPVKVIFSSNQDKTTYAYLEISADRFEVGRNLSGSADSLKEVNGVEGPPWNIRVLKKGGFYRFWVNAATSWIKGPLGEWEGINEPWESYVGIEVPDTDMIQSFTITTLPWLQQKTEPLIADGPDGSYYEQQAIPGGIIKYAGIYYLYFMGARKGDQEGASDRSISVATSTDLYNWEVVDEPLITAGEIKEEFGLDAVSNIYPSGALITREGKFALVYAVQAKFPIWIGFYLATSDHPLGPFENYENNPVYDFGCFAHEFDVVRFDEGYEYRGHKYRYLLFFSGGPYEPNAELDFCGESGWPISGDRGFMLYSDDLKTWIEDEDNPIFHPETADDWDAIHIRPRSLNMIGDTWYLWYEGCNRWRPPGSSHHGWWDTVGLARSKDLHNWEYYPRNPALPGLGISGFDSGWVGWPRMWIENGIGHVFYTGGGWTGMRTIPIDQLTNWESEGGEIITTNVGNK